MKKNCSKNILLISLCILFFVLAGAGIYFLLKEKNTKTLTVDRYQETTNWCDIQTSGDQLLINCKALLLGITQQEDQSSCFNMQIISRDDELKDLEICESPTVLTYENDILKYKILEPIDIQMQYMRDKKTQLYTLKTIYGDFVDPNYLYATVNEDIKGIGEIDIDTTSIKNSVDFCPSPSSLPSYITDENRTAYTSFYNSSIMSREQYENLYLEEFSQRFVENWENPNIKIWFGCESSRRLGYDICKTSPSINYKDINLTALPSFVSNWQEITNTNSDLISIKNLSLVFDGMLYTSTHENYTSPEIIPLLFHIISDANNNQNVYCASNKIYQVLEENNQSLKNQLEQVQTLVANNISSASSQCVNILNIVSFSQEGLYLKSRFAPKDKIFELIDRCNNLYSLITNE